MFVQCWRELTARDEMLPTVRIRSEVWTDGFGLGERAEQKEGFSLFFFGGVFGGVNAKPPHATPSKASPGIGGRMLPGGAHESTMDLHTELFVTGTVWSQMLARP